MRQARYSKLSFLLAFLLFGFSQSLFSQVKDVITEPDPDRGLYAIWYQQQPELLNLPFISGGQIMLQWAQLEGKQGVYNFKPLDAELEKMYKMGSKASVQVNGNNKPAYLYDQIAVNPKFLSPQIRDKQGTLQFWDPLYLSYYLNFIKAYGNHLKNSKYKNTVLGVRLNFNSMGTEHYFQEIGSEKFKPTDADKDYHNYKPAPNGHRFEQSFNNAAMAAYMKKVVDAFIQAFTPDVKVLSRYELLLPGLETDTTARHFLATGQMGVFMTNAEARHAHNAKEQIFLDYCRSGLAVGYAEQFSDSEGHHAGGMMNFPQWPSVWNYWRILGDLDCGISYLAIYGTDLAKDKDPQFHAAFEFGKKYVGYHASPRQAPGCWIALRTPGHLAHAISKTGPLENLSFLMDEQGKAGKMLTNVGPKNERYGAWAREINGNEALKFNINNTFKEAIKGKPVQISIVYLDDRAQQFTITVLQQSALKTVVVQRKNTGQWQKAVIDVPSADLNLTDATPDIIISAGGGGIFHLIEVNKNTI